MPDSEFWISYLHKSSDVPLYQTEAGQILRARRAVCYITESLGVGGVLRSIKSKSFDKRTNA